MVFNIFPGVVLLLNLCFYFCPQLLILGTCFSFKIFMASFFFFFNCIVTNAEFQKAKNTL